MITSASCLTSLDSEVSASQELVFREPRITDGDDVFTLITNCPPLDVNSAYCNFLQVSHFRDTCVVAEHGDEIGGFISAYRKPQDPRVLFVWQVAVAKQCRGKGLALSMLNALLARQSLRDIQAIETTITKPNSASWALFEKFDASQGDNGRVSVFLDQEQHFIGKHDTEYLYRIPTNSSANL